MELRQENLVRMVDLDRGSVGFRSAEEGSEGLGTLFGYATVFNAETEIKSFWEGHFREQMAPGSFKKTIAERGDKIKSLFNHGFDPSVGDKPLGRISELREDDKGLYIEVPLDDTSYNRDLAASLRSGAIDGMSIMFSVVREEIDESEDIPLRTIREAKLYEAGPVTFPAYEATSVGVRNQEGFKLFREGRGSSTYSETTVKNAERFVNASATGSASTLDVETDTPQTSSVPISSKRKIAGKEALRKLQPLLDSGE